MGVLGSAVDRRKFGRKAIIALSVMSVMGLASQSGDAQAEEKWNLANAYGATSIHAEGNKVFAEALAKSSGRKIVITVHPGGSLGYKSVDHFDAVGDGAVEIADTPGGFLGGIDPLMQLSSLPFLVKSVDEALILMEVAFEEYSKVFEKNGQKLLYASPWPASGIWAKAPIKSAGDLKGLKIRTYDPGGTKTFANIGAAPIQLAWGDVVPQLATGGIESVLTSAEGGVGQKFVEHTPYFTEINYALPLNFVHMNRDIYEGLSADLKKAVHSAAAEASSRNWKEVIGRTNRNYDKLKADGGTVVTDGTDNLLVDMSKAGSIILDDWLQKTGDRGKKIIEAFRAKVKS
ncbi:MAG: TRAP transporter substrate-binding protein [Sneathiellales bacterium]|nr:TRAP transporter substrate-binding protein [Sneathiellales bacterium]